MLYLRQLVVFFAIYFSITPAFAVYRDFLTYCRDCKHGKDYGTCTAEINDSLNKIRSSLTKGFARNTCKATYNRLKRAKILNLSNLNLDKLDALAEFKNITELNLINNNISILDPIAGFKQLRVLRLINNKIGNIQALSNLEQLEILELDFNNIKELEPIAHLSKIHTLSAQMNRIFDFSMVEHIENLSGLDRQIIDYNSILRLQGRYEGQENMIPRAVPLPSAPIAPIKNNIGGSEVSD